MSQEILYTFVTALLAVAVLGYVGIPMLKKLHAQQSIREDGPQNHQVKAGTPTMGGLFILLGLIISVLLFVPYGAPLWIMLLLTVGHGALGFFDDFIKAVKKRNLGLTAKQKLLGQMILAGIFAYVANTVIGLPTELWVPIAKVSIPMGLWYYPFIFLIIVGTTNAVNLTDGLDGLAAGTTAISAMAFSVVAIMVDNATVAGFMSALSGACLGFLLYNANPAKVFMGDTGSLALGGALAGAAILTKSELILAVIGGVYVIEALSVIIQVASFKTRGVRVFKMSPIHHHFELCGWKETKVVYVLWLLALVFAILGLLMMY